jgi:hypothetical protein
MSHPSEEQGVWVGEDGRVQWGSLGECDECGAICAVNAVTVYGHSLRDLASLLLAKYDTVRILSEPPSEYDFDVEDNECCTSCRE